MIFRWHSLITKWKTKKNTVILALSSMIRSRIVARCRSIRVAYSVDQFLNIFFANCLLHELYIHTYGQLNINNLVIKIMSKNFSLEVDLKTKFNYFLSKETIFIPAGNLLNRNAMKYSLHFTTTSH